MRCWSPCGPSLQAQGRGAEPGALTPGRSQCCHLVLLFVLFPCIMADQGLALLSWVSGLQGWRKGAGPDPGLNSAALLSFFLAK